MYSATSRFSNFLSSHSLSAHFHFNQSASQTHFPPRSRPRGSSQLRHPGIAHRYSCRSLSIGCCITKRTRRVDAAYLQFGLRISPVSERAGLAPTISKYRKMDGWQTLYKMDGCGGSDCCYCSASYSLSQSFISPVNLKFHIIAVRS